MPDLTIIYNDHAERRQQSLSFVGRERREIIQLLTAEQIQDQNIQAFLSTVEDIDGLKKLA